VRKQEEQIQRLLLESEQRYRRLFESGQDGILIIDAFTGLILEANP
jgi:PAS domain-containing protein